MGTDLERVSYGTRQKDKERERAIQQKQGLFGVTRNGHDMIRLEIHSQNSSRVAPAWEGDFQREGSEMTDTENKRRQRLEALLKRTVSQKGITQAVMGIENGD